MDNKERTEERARSVAKNLSEHDWLQVGDKFELDEKAVTKRLIAYAAEVRRETLDEAARLIEERFNAIDDPEIHKRVIQVRRLAGQTHADAIRNLQWPEQWPFAPV